VRAGRPVAVGAAVLLASGLAGCKSNAKDEPTPDVTVTHTLPGKPPTNVTPRPTLSNGAGLKEIDKPCPYISDRDWAQGEGNRVGRSVQLNSKPVGCRFYFEYNAIEARGQILVQRFKTAIEASNAVVVAAQGHPEFVDDRSIGDGSISRRVLFDGAPAWQCVFAKGTFVVTVQTSQTNTSLNARSLAADIEPNIR